MLVLDSLTYKNDLNQDFTVSKLKYYISAIRFKAVQARDFFSDTSYLIDEENSASKVLIINGLPAPKYNAIEFIVGVDSLHNCSGAQSGALDPVNAMFWAWNTGYIFLKLEGRTSFSKSPGHFFEYHIGGYKQPDNNIKQIRLNFKQPIEVKAGKITNIDIGVDVLEILKAPNPLDFSKLPGVTDVQKGKVVADNYADMFSLIQK